MVLKFYLVEFRKKTGVPRYRPENIALLHPPGIKYLMLLYSRIRTVPNKLFAFW